MDKNNNYQPVKYAKAPSAGDSKTKKSKNPLKTVLLFFTLLLFIVGSASVILISRKQELEPGPVAPNVPQSQPEAYIPVEESCVTTFSVPLNLSCAESGCADDNDCQEDYVCIQGAPNEGVAIAVGICGLASQTDECRNQRDYDSCCVEPTISITPSPTPSVEPTTTPTPSLTLTPTPEPTGTPSPTQTPEPTPTDKPVATPTPTTVTTPPKEEPTPVLTQVITTVGCNESCSENTDCDNVSHICYEGLCRLDVNPTDVNCRLPDGNNVIERPAVVPTESGFADWFNYLKAGLGVLGFGALLLLLL
jgi:hypothetical protein